MIERVGSVTISVPDIDAALAFYRNKVGLVESERSDDSVYLTSNERHHELILRQGEGNGNALLSFNLQVSDGALDAAVDRALAAGAVLLADSTHTGVAAAKTLRAPDGFTIELFSGMAARPTDVTLAENPPLHFSHFNLGTPDAKATSDFFIQAFGMEPSDWLGDPKAPFLTWLHCPVLGANHHGVAILQSDETKLHHIAFDYGNVQQVVDRVDGYVDETHYLVWGMGRHGTGGSLFSYIEDPGDMLVELGTGMIRIGVDARWSGPKVWAMDDRRGVDAWGSGVPDAWLAKSTPLV